jgi:hypothetical protein
LVAGGLIYLRLNKSENWSSPWHTYLPVAVIYLLLGIFLVVTPFFPPNSDWNADGYPYYAFPLVGTGVLLLGVVYWLLGTRGWLTWTGCSVARPAEFNEGDQGVTECGKRFPDQRLSGDAAEEPLLGQRGRREIGYSSID